MKAQIEELKHYLISYKLRAGPVISIGPLPFMSLGDSLIITGTGFPLREARELPTRYSAVKKLPTWLVETEKGEVLLEGLTSIGKYIHPDGYLLLPAKILDADMLSSTGTREKPGETAAESEP